MRLPYREVIEADPAGGYVGHIPALRGCVTQAETKMALTFIARSLRVPAER